MLAVFWQPKENTTLRLRTLYKHTYSWNLEGCFNDPANHWFNFPTTETGMYMLKLRTHKKIEKAIAHVLPRRRFNLLQKKQIKLYDYARRLLETGCPEPKIHEDNLGLSWIVEDLSPKKVYTCVFYHENAYKWIDNLLK